MKQSKFNMYFKADDGNKLAFNSYSCGLAVVDESYERLIKSLSDLNDDNVPDDLKECYSAAVEGRFIVDDDVDELLELQARRNIQKYSLDTLGLTIAPTLACNFKCIYCYETSKSGVMQEDVFNGIVNYVKSQANHLKHLGISWYGGEPLLCKDIIYRLSEEFLAICKENNIEYNAFMISNGSLLDDETIEKMIEYHINGIQITIDGVPEIHNARRVNKAGTDTFNLIIDNINKLLATGKIEVVIRINIDKSNNDGVDELLSILSERLINKNVKISFGQVSAYTEACRSIESSCYDNSEFASEILKYFDVIKKYGFDCYNTFPYPEVKYNYCCAEMVNSFVVDHEGYLYKCWNEVGNVENSVGNIKGGFYDVSSCKNASWFMRNPFLSKKCSECSVLPVCMGGCPHNDVVLKKDNVCDLIRYHVEDIMLHYYNMSKEGE